MKDLEFLKGVFKEGTDPRTGDTIFYKSIESGQYRLVVKFGLALVSKTGYETSKDGTIKCEFFFIPSKPYSNTDKQIPLYEYAPLIIDSINYPGKYIKNGIDTRISQIKKQFTYLNTMFNYIYSTLDKMPKSSEFQYIFGELVDFGFALDVGYGFYYDKYEVWGGNKLRSNTNQIFKVVVMLSIDADKISKEVYNDLVDDFKHGLKRLTSQGFDIHDDIEENAHMTDFCVSIFSK